MLIQALNIVGDAVSIMALAMMFGLARAVAKALPGASAVKVWAPPVIGLLVQLPLGALARLWPDDPVEAGAVLAGRTLVAGLFALAHLSLVRREGP